MEPLNNKDGISKRSVVSEKQRAGDGDNGQKRTIRDANSCKVGEVAQFSYSSKPRWRFPEPSNSRKDIQLVDSESLQQSKRKDLQTPRANSCALMEA